MKFSLVIPCYNESQNIPLLLEKCKSIPEELKVEVILVDNGSVDDTNQVFMKLLPAYPKCRLVSVEKNIGYGYGILAGLRVAKGELLGWTHADLQTDPLDAINGLKLFEKYGDDIFVKGRRNGRPITDVFFTIAMSLFETLLLKKIMWDINAQPTMFSRKFYDTLENPPLDFSLDLYVYYRAKAQRLKVHRIPVKFGARAHGVSHWNINLSSKWKFICRTIKFSFQLKKKIS